MLSKMSEVMDDNHLLAETTPERIASHSDERLEELYRELSTVPNIQSNLAQILRNRAELVRAEEIRRKQEKQEAEADQRHREQIAASTRPTVATLGENMPDDVKSGDIKALLKHIVSQRYSSGRTKDTLSQLINAVWDHTQCLLHDENATKQEAMRIYLWSALLISEIYELEK